MFILFVYDNNELIAIAPFMMSKNKHTIIDKPNISVTVKKIEFIANVHSNRCDIIYKKDPEEVCNSIVKFLLSEYKNSWDILSLEYLLKDSPTNQYLKASLDKKSICSKQYPQISSPYLCIEHAWKDYFKNRQRRFKEQLKSRLKKLEELGSVMLKRHQNESELTTILEQIGYVASKSWKAKENTAFFSTEQLQKFYTDLTFTAKKEGWLELFILYLNEKPLAFEYCLKFGNKLFLLKTEFDEAYRPYGVGNIIQWKLLEGIFQDGIKEFDFLGPSATWKNHWSDGSEREHITFYAFNKNYKGQLLNYAYAAKDAVKRMLGKDGWQQKQADKLGYSAVLR